MVTENRVFRALADPTRRQILLLLRGRECPVGEIAERFPMSRPAISKHLRLLREANLASERRQGRERLYALEPDALQAVEEWLRRARAADGEPLPEPAPEPRSRRSSPRQRRARPVRSSPEAPPPEPQEEDWKAW